jgi:hypothetical protein
VVRNALPFQIDTFQQKRLGNAGEQRHDVKRCQNVAGWDSLVFDGIIKLIKVFHYMFVAERSADNFTKETRQIV